MVNITHPHKKMNTKSEKFPNDIVTLRKFLADRKLLGELAERSGSKSRTVQYALSAKSEKDLKGKQLKVYKEALIMKKEIEDLFSQYCDETTIDIK